MSVQPKKISELDSATVGALATKMGIKPADVYLFEFENQTFTTYLRLHLPGITQEILDSSILFCKYIPNGEDSSANYFIPGPGSLGTLVYRCAWILHADETVHQCAISAHAWNTGAMNSSLKTFAKIKIFVIRVTPKE